MPKVVLAKDTYYPVFYITPASLVDKYDIPVEIPQKLVEDYGQVWKEFAMVQHKLEGYYEHSK